MQVNLVLRTQRIIWFALLMTCFIYMFLAFFVLKTKPGQPPPPIMPLALGVVALSVTVASFIVPAIVYKQAAKLGNQPTKEEAAPNAFPEGYRDAMPKRIIFADPASAMSQAVLTHQTPLILSMALSEAVALFGLVLSQLGFDAMVTLPFFLAGTVLLAIRFPMLPRILKNFEQARGASFPEQNG